MKKFKKIASMLLAMVMVLSFGITASAATVTVENAVVGETYSIYKIFDAVYNSDGSSVTYTIDSNSDWYSTVSNAISVFKLTKLSETTVGENTVSTYQVEVLAGVSDTDVIAIFTSVDTTDFDVAATSVEATSDSVVWSELTTGYYFITSSLGSLVTINSVNDTVTVKDKNKENDNLTKTVKGSDGNVITSASIGDVLTYTITSSVPLVWDNQTMTEYTFVDTLPSGLTYNENSVSVTITGTDDDGIDVSINSVEASIGTDTDGYTTITVTYNPQNIQNYPTVDATITITYTATLNANASSKETNKVTSSINQNGTTETVYTYGFRLKKVKEAQDGDVLEGAKFNLYKDNSALEGVNDELIYFTYDSSSKTYTVCTSSTQGADATITVGNATIFGLEEGTYYLVETEAPTGYNLTTDKTSVTVGENGETTGLNNTTAVVINNAGSSLPSTGGIGTTIFYVVGTIMVLGAVVVLITRKRMSAE